MPSRFLLLMFIIGSSCIGFARAMAADDAMLRSERMQRWDAVATLVETARIDGALAPQLPVQGVVTADLRDSFESPRTNGRRHAAIDIMAPRNTPVLAAVDGEIRKLATSSGGGLTIYQFDAREERVYYYAHLERYRSGLRAGMIVRRGEIIGYVGTSGNAPAASPHLHFAVGELPASKEFWKAVPVDPYLLLVDTAVAGGDSEAARGR